MHPLSYFKQELFFRDRPFIKNVSSKWAKSFQPGTERSTNRQSLRPMLKNPRPYYSHLMKALLFISKVKKVVIIELAKYKLV